MGKRWSVVWVIVAVLLSACAGRPLPQATPTVAPTRTPSPTAAGTTVAQNGSPTPLPTMTHTPSASPSRTATEAATLTPSNTVSPTPTRTPSATVRPTNTPLPLMLPTNTATQTLTPTVTPSLSPTPTDTATPLPTATATPLPTNTPTQTPTAAPTNTATPPPTWTPLPTVPVVLPTLDATPTFATLPPNEAAPDLLPTSTVVQGDATAETPSTLTPTPAPTVANVTPPPTISVDSILIPPIVPSDTTRAFALGAGGAGTSFNLPTNANPQVFARNPRNPNVYVTTDSIGFYSIIVNGQPQGLPAPFTEFYPESRAANDKLVTDATWSPDGRFVAFVVDNPDQRGGNDGVWWYEPGVNSPTQVLVNCRPRAAGCAIVQPAGAPYNWHVESVVWSDSQRMLARTFMYADDFNGQMGALVLERGTDKAVRGHMIAYEYTHWTNDGGRLVVSGRDGQGRWTFGTVALDGQDYQPVAAAGQLWVQDAVQSGGRLVGLGRAGDANGAMRLVAEDGAFLTEDIGAARPAEVIWNPARDTAYVRTADGRSFLASVNGTVREITGQVGDIQAVGWVQGELPPNLAEGYAGGIPSGVVEGSQYAPGQQLIIRSNTGGLNLRTQPSTNAGVVVYVLNGAYVAVLAGPVETDEPIGRVTWWQVQDASGAQGWMAGSIGGVETFVVP